MGVLGRWRIGGPSGTTVFAGKTIFGRRADFRRWMPWARQKPVDCAGFCQCRESKRVRAAPQVGAAVTSVASVMSALLSRITQ